MPFRLDPNLTLEEYVSTLSDADRQILVGFPLTVDELIDTDRDELNQLKVATGLALTEEQQAQRADMIEKIMYLQMYAVLEDDAKQDQWCGQKNDNGNGKPVKQSKFSSSDVQFVIATIAKEAPYDVTSIKQIFYGMCSAFTKLPLHHSVNSRKSGAGKTHNLTKTASYFPKKYVIAMAGMSDKALFHRHGTLVIVDDETGNTIHIKPLIDGINDKIENLELELANSDDNNIDKARKKEIKEEIAKLRDEIQEINEKSQKLIELDNKIFLFLDTAQEGLFNTLMSMISQDTDDQLYEFTDKNGGGSGKLGSKINRLRGTPTIFNTQVKTGKI